MNRSEGRGDTQPACISVLDKEIRMRGGRMEYILTAAQMKQCDQDTICKIGIPSMVLMERAALSVVSAMYEKKWDLSSVLVLCGSGNNGGDGFAVARILAERKVPVAVAFVGNDASMTEETRLQRKICETCGIKCVSNFMQREYTTIVDAIFGIGLSRAVQGSYAQIIDWVNEQKANVIAVDIPSGVCADSGRILGIAVKADLTVTFAYRKTGMMLYPGAQYCGRIICSEIGIQLERFADIPAKQFIYSREDLRRVPQRNPYSNKGTYGKVLLIAGSEGMCGAACLAALAAYRSGSGLVRVFTPECNRAVIQSSLPEAIVTCYDEKEVQIEKLQDALEWADAAAIGPGLGQSAAAEQILEYVLEHFEKPLAADADALNLLAKRKELFQKRNGNMIVTPHIGEMMRLVKKEKQDIVEDLIHTAKEFARTNQVICVLKDARTVVSDGEKVYINISGNSGMAVGGSGDVLTGLLAGLLAQHMELFEAAAAGVYLHGLAGDAARERKGAYGMLASDIADSIGDVLKELEDF